MNLLQDKINSTTASTFISLTNSLNYKIVSEQDLWEKGYTYNPIVYSVINGIASKCASLPLDVMRGEELAADDDDFNTMWCDKWNESYGKEEGLRLAMTNLLTFGVAYIEKKGDGLLPDELHVLPNQYVTPETGLISFYENPSYYYFQDSANI